MLARGWACLHTACPERSRRVRLPVPKIPAAKPCVSISSKLIENKRFKSCIPVTYEKQGEGARDFVVAELQIGHSIGKSAGIKASATLGNETRRRKRRRLGLRRATSKNRENRLRCALSLCPPETGAASIECEVRDDDKRKPNANCGQPTDRG